MLQNIKNFWARITGRKKEYSLECVYTPTKSAIISYIVRKNEENKLRKALKIPGKQVVIYGHSGSGKSTMLNHVVDEMGIQTITSRCTDISTIETIILDAFDQLDPYYIDTTTNAVKSGVSASLGSDYMGIKSKLLASYEVSDTQQNKRALPPQLTIQRLADFIGQAGAVWVIEDYHKVVTEDKTRISQMMKLFMDKADKYPASKIVVLGAADKGYEVVQYDPELNNRVTEIEVPLLTTHEIKQIVQKGAEALNIGISEQVTTKIAENSNGLATIAHQLCYNICSISNIEKTQKKYVKVDDSCLAQAVKEFTEEKQSTYHDTYLRITAHRKRKYDNVEIILAALAQLSDDATHNELLVAIQKNEPAYRQSNLTTYLNQLTTPAKEEVLRNNAGRYSFADPFFKAYVKMLIDDN